MLILLICGPKSARIQLPATLLKPSKSNSFIILITIGCFTRKCFSNIYAASSKQRTRPADLRNTWHRAVINFKE